MDDPIELIAERLRAAAVPFAVIGAAAMSARGIPRQTLDLDLLVTDDRVLLASFWEGLPIVAEVRRGDTDDPLAGVVRFDSPQVDVIVGRFRWQSEALARAEEQRLGGRSLPVVTVSDLILLKLHAGGYRDATDVHLLLTVAGRSEVEQVERSLEALPTDARRLWKEIREGR
jgi:predicted nucleotidyltransferase